MVKIGESDFAEDFNFCFLMGKCMNFWENAEIGLSLEEERREIAMMEDLEDADQFTDSDSDGDGPPDIQVAIFEDFDLLMKQLD